MSEAILLNGLLREIFVLGVSEFVLIYRPYLKGGPSLSAMATPNLRTNLVDNGVILGKFQESNTQAP
jgi:hypothetical protein